jgi:hypothetical protein
VKNALSAVEDISLASAEHFPEELATLDSSARQIIALRRITDAIHQGNWEYEVHGDEEIPTPLLKRSTTYNHYWKSVMKSAIPDRPLCSIDEWLSDPVGAVMATEGLHAESDDDLEMEVTSTVRLECPITLRLMQDPVSSTTCIHSFEKQALIDLLRSADSIRCPVSGCTAQLSKGGFVANRRIKRMCNHKRMAV